MVENIYAVILIFIYILFILIFNLYVTINRKKDSIDINEKIAIMLYCYGKRSPYKLFKVTCMDLIEKKYFSIVKDKESSYIKINNKKIDDLSEYEKLCYNSIKELSSKYKTLEELDMYFSTSYVYGKVLNDFYLALKKEVSLKYGRVYKYASYITTAIFTFVYGLQVLSTIKVDLNQMIIVLLSILLVVITVLLTSLLNNFIKKVDFKKIVAIIIASFGISVLSFNIWNNFYNVDYIIMHVIFGVFTYLYPLYLYTCIYLVRTNYLFINKKQKDIINYLDNIKENLINKKRYTKEDYIYLYGLSIKKKVKEDYLK